MVQQSKKKDLRKASEQKMSISNFTTITKFYSQKIFSYFVLMVYPLLWII